MADVAEEFLGSQDENGKIRCKSGKSVDDFMLLIQNIINEVIADSECGNESRELCKKRLFEVYHKALQTNLLIGSSDKQNSESVYEGIDVEKERFLNTELIPQLDTQLVDVSIARKTGSHILHSHLKRAIRAQLRHSALQKVTVDNEQLEGTESALQELAENLLVPTPECHGLSSLHQFSTDLLAQSHRLMESVRMNKRFEKSEAFRAVDGTPPRTPPKARPLYQQENPSIIKKLL